ncbi:MAG: PAS domain S-box protein [Micavibrio sp.]
MTFTPLADKSGDYKNPGLSAFEGSYLAAIIESSNDVIISKDLDGVITSWNPAAERVFGYKADEVTGKHISLLIPADRLDEETEIITRIKTGRRVEHFETVRMTKNGDLINISLTISPIHDSKGVLIGASKIARDITEKKRTEAMLEKAAKDVEAAQQAKANFLANISHEVRTPLNVIAGLVNILQGRLVEDAKVREILNTLKISTEHLSALINDLLDISKIEDEGFSLEAAPFRLSDIIDDIAKIQKIEAERKSITLEVCTKGISTNDFAGDLVRIRQIMMNLVGNALKFTQEGFVRITVETGAVGNDGKATATIHVVDSGIGIDAAQIDKIFMRFVQADESITRRYGGTGLGLAISKQLAGKMGGTITVKSIPGEGSHFTVTLRLEARGDKIGLSENGGLEADRPHGKTAHILLVEDYAPNVLVAGMMIESLGYSYEAAANGIEALAMMERGDFDLALMDTRMPEKDGLQACSDRRRAERENPALRHFPIIAMTAYAMPGDREKCFAAGMDEHIAKPFDLADLKSKINALLPADKIARDV